MHKREGCYKGDPDGKKMHPGGDAAPRFPAAVGCIDVMLKPSWKQYWFPEGVSGFEI